MLVADIQTLISDWVYSLITVGLGLLLGLLLAILTTALRVSIFSFLPRLQWLNFLFEIIKYPPPIAWIPIVILLIGIHFFSGVVIITLAAYPPLSGALYSGLIKPPGDWLKLAQSLDFKSSLLFFRIRLRLIAPEFFVGLKSALSSAWMAVIASELVTGSNGLGYRIQLLRLNLEYEKILFYIFIIGLTGYLLSKLVGILEDRLLPWKVEIKQ